VQAVLRTAQKPQPRTTRSGPPTRRSFNESASAPSGSGATIALGSQQHSVTRLAIQLARGNPVSQPRLAREVSVAGPARMSGLAAWSGVAAARASAEAGNYTSAGTLSALAAVLADPPVLVGAAITLDGGGLIRGGFGQAVPI
jgi:hypothetical protein